LLSSAWFQVWFQVMVFSGREGIDEKGKTPAMDEVVEVTGQGWQRQGEGEGRGKLNGHWV
jgi:hypothetical protein